MEYKPFADAIEPATTIKPSTTISYEIDILRDSNRELKLTVLDLEEKVKAKEEIINTIKNITQKNG